MKKHITYLNSLSACEKAVVWATQFPTLQKAWDKCERGDWMLWLIVKQAGGLVSKSRKKLVLTACKCARLALKYVPKEEKRPLKAIQTTEKWANGDSSISLDDIRNAANAADAAYAAYYAAAYAANAADAAPYAAYAAYAAAHAALDDIRNAVYAANAAYYAAARSKVLEQCADIVREMYPKIRIK